MSISRCPHDLPAMWPNTHERVQSVRLFRAWHPSWGDDAERRRAWADLVSWIHANGAQVLVGTDVTCDARADDELWGWTLELMGLIGRERILGVAVGNEMDVLRDAEGAPLEACNAELWHGRYWRTLLSRAGDLDAHGFEGVRLTVVWAMSVLVGSPWRESEGWGIRRLASSAHARWGDRWVWSFNVYDVWDSSRWPASRAACAKRARAATSVRYTKAVLRVVRQRIRMITGRYDDGLWVMGAGGGGAPFCEAFFTPPAIQRAYEQFMSWDLSLGMGLPGPERAFFFAARGGDAAAAGFGLVRACGSRLCRVQHDATVPGILRLAL